MSKHREDVRVGSFARRCGLGLALAGASGCASDAASSVNPIPEDGPLYAMVVTVPTPDGESSVNYLVAAPSLEAGAEVNPAGGVEGTLSIVYGVGQQPSVWGDNADPTLSRWGLREGLFGLDETISFANLGLLDVYNPIWHGALLSPELAVMGNDLTGELVRWNPTTMQIEGVLPLGLPGSPDGRYPTLWETKVRPDGTVISSWYRELYDDADNLVSSTAGTLTLNQDATQIIEREEWEIGEKRRVSFARGGLLADGTVYTSPSQSCDDVACGPVVVHRVLPGATAYDREWQGNLSQLTGLSTDWVRGTDGYFYALNDRVFFSLQHTEEGERPAEVKWFVADAELSTAREIPTAGFLGSGAEYVFQVDGRLFMPDWRAVVSAGSRGDTPVYEITEDGFVPAFSITGGGIVYNVVRIR